MKYKLLYISIFVILLQLILFGCAKPITTVEVIDLNLKVNAHSEDTSSDSNVMNAPTILLSNNNGNEIINSVVYNKCFKTANGSVSENSCDGFAEEIDNSDHVYSVNELKEKYPQYFGLSGLTGLEIYVCSYSPNNYSYRIKSGTNRLKTIEELQSLPAISADEVKTILDSYNNLCMGIYIWAWLDPSSVYHYEIDEEYCNSVSEQFKYKYHVTIWPPLLS